MTENIMVSVLCTAYNHEKFIEDAIKGVLKQKTDFKFELIIHDDASTDTTAEIIKKYEKKNPDIIHAILQAVNQYQQCNIYHSFLFPNAKGKYIAFCEGDDYWIDEEKLQKQVSFLESHEEYSMCMHNAIRLNYVSGKQDLLNTFPRDGTYTQKEQILAGLGTDFPAFASYLIRANLLDGIPAFFLASKVLDYPLRQYYANCGKVYYFDKPMSVYRVSTPQSYMKKTAEDQLFYNNYTVEMIKFFEEFKQYAGEKFNALLKCKIISDYFGFCLSIHEKEGINKALAEKLDIDMVKNCYYRLSPGYLDNSVLGILSNSDKIFIYGISRIAPICKKQLEHAGIEIEGFVVSDGQVKVEVLEGKRVFYLSEVITRYRKPGFVLALQPINAAAVSGILDERGIDNYCQPYMVNSDRKAKELN